MSFIVDLCSFKEVMCGACGLCNVKEVDKTLKKIMLQNLACAAI